MSTRASRSQLFWKAELVYGGMVPADVQKTLEKEFEMALQDREYWKKQKTETR